jgi:hypothetical protein
MGMVGSVMKAGGRGTGGLLAGLGIAAGGLYGAKKLNDMGASGAVSGVTAGTGILAGGIMAGGGIRSAGKILNNAGLQRAQKVMTKSAGRNALKSNAFKGLGKVGIAAGVAGGGYGYYQSKQGNYGKAALGGTVALGGLAMGGKSYMKGARYARTSISHGTAASVAEELMTKAKGGKVAGKALARTGKRNSQAVASGAGQAVAALPGGPSKGQKALSGMGSATGSVFGGFNMR